MRTGLGQLLVEYDNGDKFTATGILCQVDSKDRAYLAEKIGKTFLLTAANNVCRLHKGMKQYSSKITFLLGKKNDDHGIAIGVKQIKTMKAFSFSSSDGTDVAFMTPIYPFGTKIIDSELGLCI